MFRFLGIVFWGIIVFLEKYKMWYNCGYWREEGIVLRFLWRFVGYFLDY